MVAEAASRIRPGAGVRRTGGRAGPRRGVRLGIGARPVPGRGARRFVGLPRSPGRDSTAAPRPGVAPFPGRADFFTGRSLREDLPRRGASPVAGSVGSGFRSRHREFSASGTREPYGAAATGTVAPRREFRLVPVSLPAGPAPAVRIGGSNRRLEPGGGATGRSGYGGWGPDRSGSGPAPPLLRSARPSAAVGSRPPDEAPPGRGAGGHLASALSTSRSSRMIFSACAIWRANSTGYGVIR